VVNRSYLICATPRTGSHLLCDALAGTGLAGRPIEFLMASYRKQRSAEWGTSTFEAYHQLVLAEGTTPNGIFGGKIHSGQFDEFVRWATGKPFLCMEDRPAIVDTWFPRPRYVWLRRQDQVQQAVSWTRACQTRIWWDTEVAPAPMDAPMPDALRFDYLFIEEAMYSLAFWDGIWRTYFDATGISPLTVWYEELVADRSGTVERVLAFLDIESGTPQTEEPARFRRQAGDASKVWGARFERLYSAKRESNLAAFSGLHDGETIYICTSETAEDRVPRDAITIAINGAPSPLPASYALVTENTATAPQAGVVFTTGEVSVAHPFVVRFLLDQQGPGALVGHNRLPLGNDKSEAGIAMALALHLGGRRIEMA